MKKFLPLLLLLPLPAFAAPIYKYRTTCYLESQNQLVQDTCTVVETRENDGALKTRNIYSNKFSLTVKSWFDDKQGFMTWDSHNKFNYKWQYKANQYGSYVMPGFLVENVSWD